MGIFDKIFGKKKSTDNIQNSEEMETIHLQKGDTIVSTGENTFFKIIRPISDEQKQAIEKSTIFLRSDQLFMHYYTDNLVCVDRKDPEWQNKVMFFWKAEEPFPKKSLPQIFETFKTKYFLFIGDTSKVSLQVGQVAPWFGMPGLGEKHFCELNGERVTVPELHIAGLVEYFEKVELTSNNLDILNNKEDFFFLIDNRTVQFENGNFYLVNNPISIDLAYSVGGIHIIRKAKLE